MAHLQRGQLDRALLFARRMLESAGRRHGEKSEWVGLSLAYNAEVHAARKDFEAVEPLLERSVQILDRTALGKNTFASRCLNILGKTYLGLGRYDQAEKMALRLLRHKELELGEDHIGLSSDLDNLILIHRAAGNLDTAISMAKRLLQLHVKHFGSTHLAVAKDLDQMAELSAAQKKFSTERALRERALKMRELLLGAEHLDTTVNMLPLALCYLKNQAPDLALAMARRSLTIREKHLGAEDESLSVDWGYLGDLYMAADDPTKAESSYQRARRLQERIWGPGHLAAQPYLVKLMQLYELTKRPDEAAAIRKVLNAKPGALEDTGVEDLDRLRMQGDLLFQRGDLARSEKTYLHMIALLEKAHGVQYPALAKVLDQLGGVYLAWGRLPEAENVLTRGLDILDFDIKPSPVYEGLLNRLYVCYQRQGKGEELSKTFERMREWNVTTHGEKSQELAELLLMYALFLHEQRDYQRAESRYQEAYELFVTTLGKEHARADLTLSNLAVMYEQGRNVQKAGPMFERLLALREENYGPNDPKVAECLNHLTYMTRDLGRFEESKAFALRAYGIWSNSDNLKEVGGILNELAFISMQMGQNVDAERYARQALKINEQVEGKEGRAVANSLNYMGKILFGRAHYNEAEPLFRRAVMIAEKHMSPIQSTGYLDALAILYQSQGRHQKAAELYQKVLKIFEETYGERDAQIVVSLNRVADHHMLLGEVNKAVPTYLRALEILRDTYGEDNPANLPVLDRLVNAYKQADRSRDTYNAQQEAARIRKLQKK